MNVGKVNNMVVNINNDQLWLNGKKIISESDKTTDDSKNLALRMQLSKEGILKSSQMSMKGYIEAKAKYDSMSIQDCRNRWVKHTLHYLWNFSIASGADEMMRYDEPETYEKYNKAIHDNIGKGDAGYKEADDIFFEWFNRRCMNTGKYKNPVAARTDAIDAVDNYYSNQGIDADIDFCKDGKPNTSEKYGIGSLWRYDGKYSVLMTNEMMMSLPNAGTKEQSSTLSRIDDAIKTMQGEAEKLDDKFSFIRYGVELHNNGSSTFHALYNLDHQDQEISADTADELVTKLQKLADDSKVADKEN